MRINLYGEKGPGKHDVTKTSPKYFINYVNNDNWRDILPALDCMQYCRDTVAICPSGVFSGFVEKGLTIVSTQPTTLVLLALFQVELIKYWHKKYSRASWSWHALYAVITIMFETK